MMDALIDCLLSTPNTYSHKHLTDYVYETSLLYLDKVKLECRRIETDTQSVTYICQVITKLLHLKYKLIHLR